MLEVRCPVHVGSKPTAIAHILGSPCLTRTCSNGTTNIVFPGNQKGLGSALNKHPVLTPNVLTPCVAFRYAGV